MLVFFPIDVVEQYHDGRENREHKGNHDMNPAEFNNGAAPIQGGLVERGSSNPTMEMMIPEIKTPPAPISLCTNELTVPAVPLLYDLFGPAPAPQSPCPWSR